ncbi:MAG: hypothetical protein DRN06_02345 [Thermoprotei archaeon]|nr:MAG: hypothetical protein DRN06_02345 [Thermoprotei archaeon]
MRQNFLVLEITDKCMLNCSHCFKKDRKDFHVPVEHIKDRMRAVLSEVSAIVLSGGEPFLHPHLEEIIEAATKERKHVAITTNGLILKENIQILTSYVDQVTILCSLDYPDGRHDYHRGFSGLIKLIKESLTSLKRADVETRILSTILSDNCYPSDIQGLIRFSKKYCNSHTGETILFQRYFPIYGGPQPLTAKQFSEAIEAINRYSREESVGARVIDNLYFHDVARCLERYFCSTDGEWSICRFSPFRFRNLSMLKDFKRMLPKIPEDCEGCRYAEQCRGGCLAYRASFCERGLGGKDCLCSGPYAE